MQAFGPILAVLARYPRIILAIQFGSLAIGRARPDSDLDCAVRAEAPLTADEKYDLIGDLGEALGRPVDLVDLATAGVPLLGEILKGRLLMGSDKRHARLIPRHLIDTADLLPLRGRILKERRRAWIGG